METPELTDAVRKRARGTLLASAVGDVLGVPYELDTIALEGDPQPIGGGLGDYAPGEWSDDTQMSICIAQVAATGVRLTSQAAQDDIATKFLAWSKDGATDIGIQTSRVLSDAHRREGTASQRLRAAAAYFSATSDRAAGNGALMRTAPIGLAFLYDRDLTAQAAREIAALTHTDPMVGDTCVLWSEAIRHAVTTGRIDIYAGLDLLHPDVHASMIATLKEAEEPSFKPESNSFTITAIQSAWHAVVMAKDTDDPIRNGLFEAIRQGSDTDTTAAVAGALLGAAFGEDMVPDYEVHGWPGLTGKDLANLGETIVEKCRPRY